MTLLYWLDEPRLHDGTLYLPALPPQYDSNRLLEVFQSSKVVYLCLSFSPALIYVCVICIITKREHQHVEP